MTILCYHSVQPEWASPLAVEPADFAEQCAWLHRRRRVLPLDEAVRLLDRSGRLPRGTAALTFDDGFAELHRHALPVLTRYRFPWTVFLVAQTLAPGGQPVDWVDTPPPPPQRLSTLTADQVLEMQELGVDFQSHSYAHLDLTELSFAECVTDLRTSRELLSDLLGRSVSSLAFPRGRHSEQVRRAAERAGYHYAFSLPERHEPIERFAIPRVGIYRGNCLRAVRIKSARPYLPLRTHRRYEQLAGVARRVPARG
jgi:peptidoglycan/xylan/chitin deacetylase (PgdA/CDA1 family)